jgi:dihydrolipoamide dehydrogenase
VKTPDGETTLEADVLLSAVGVSANIEGIGLEELGIKTEKAK